MKNKTPYLAEGQDLYFSLHKLTGKNIKDILGYPSSAFGDPVFKISQIIFEDGSIVWLEGEHDFPYLGRGSGDFPNLDDDTLESFLEEDEEE